MTDYFVSDYMNEQMNKIQLLTLSSGHAKVDYKWSSRILSTPFSRLYYMLDGSYTIYSETGEPYVLSKGNCYLLPANYKFRYRYDTYMEQVYLHIKLCDSDGIDMLSACKQILSYPVENISYYAELVHSESMTDMLHLRLEVYTSLCTLLDKYQITLQKPEYSPQVCHAIDYINTHLTIQLNTVELAAKTFMAPSTLARKFKQETGQTIGQYIDNSVLFHAEHLLLTTNMSIAEISVRTGFCDQIYFAKKFKEKFGLSPRQYRKLNINA